MTVNMPQIMREEARLIVLRELAAQVSEALPSSILEAVLPVFGIYQERAWLHQQMEYLETMGAVTLLDAGTVKIATLTELGKRHLARHVSIEGVKRPSRPVG